MKLGLGSFAYGWAVGVPGYPQPAQPLTALGLIQRAHALGLRLVQIADNLPLHTLPDEDFETLVETAGALEVAVEVGTRGIDLPHLRTYLHIAGRFNSPILRVVIDTRTHHPGVDEIIATLSALLPEFYEAGVILAIENHDRFKVRTLADIVVKLNEGYDRRVVGVCLDTANSFGALEGPEVVVNTLGAGIVNLHIKGFSVRRLDHQMGFAVEGAPVGEGMLDVPWLLGKLRALGLLDQINGILETWPPPEADFAQTLAKENAWVEQSVAYLRTLITE